MIPLSPSNLKTFRQCPRKFQAQYVTKKLKWKKSAALDRGNEIHKCMETALKYGWGAVNWPDEERDIRPFCEDMVSRVDKLRMQGWTVEVEFEAATNGLGKPSGWWDGDVFIRSKIDVLAWHPDKRTGFILDWKTGKPWDDELQLHVNAMCAAPHIDKQDFKIAFCYVDQKYVAPFAVGVDFPRPATFRRKNITLPTKLLDTLILIDNVRESFDKDFWPPSKNRFCSNCGFMECENNGG